MPTRPTRTPTSCDDRKMSLPSTPPSKSFDPSPDVIQTAAMPVPPAAVSTSPVQIDRGTAATDTIDYVLTDSHGLTRTSTRTAVVEPAIVPATFRTTSRRKHIG